MECKAYLISDSIDIKALPSELKLKETCFFRVEDNIYVIFPYGVVVCWGDGNLAPVLFLLQPHLKAPFDQSKVIFDEFAIETDNNDSSKFVFDDTIYLKEMDELILVAISHSLAQSLRLIKFEDATIESISNIIHIPQTLAKHGKIKETKKEISKMQGHLYSLKSMIRLEYSVLDKPEFFWEYPEYDEYYDRMTNYLEINQRLSILDKKFDTIDEILAILSDELNHRHSSNLEWIIIILILFEIVIFFIQDVFKII